MCADDETINNLANASGTQFTCFNGTKVQILTPWKALLASRPPDPLQMGEKKQTKEKKKKKKQQFATGSTQEESAV